MTKLENVTEIAAPVDAVWDVLTDTSYIVKLFQDAISVTIDPPGRSALGQKYHVLGKAGRRKVDIYLELVELVPKKRIANIQRPGGLFKSFKQLTLVEPKGNGTEVETSFDYELSMGYIGRALNLVLVERLVRDNLDGYAKTLKEIAELVPLPAAESN